MKNTNSRKFCNKREKCISQGYMPISILSKTTGLNSRIFYKRIREREIIGYLVNGLLCFKKEDWNNIESDSDKLSRFIKSGKKIKDCVIKIS